MTKSQDWKRITIYITPDEHKMIRMASFEKGISTSEFLRHIILNKLAIETGEQSAQ